MRPAGAGGWAGWGSAGAPRSASSRRPGAVSLGAPMPTLRATGHLPSALRLVALVAVIANVPLDDRSFVIAEILNAGVVDCRIVEVGAGDLPFIRVMGPPPPLLPDHAASVMNGNNQTSAWVRRLVNEGAVCGPLLAVSGSATDAMTILDGIHRADAWATRLASGEDDRLTMNLVITTRPTYFEHV